MHVPGTALQRSAARYGGRRAPRAFHDSAAREGETCCHSMPGLQECELFKMRFRDLDQAKQVCERSQVAAWPLLPEPVPPRLHASSMPGAAATWRRGP